MPHINGYQRIEQVSIRQEGERVLIIKGGVAVLDVPPEAAIEIGRGLIAKARQAMEVRPKVAEQTAIDAGLLLRIGAPFGITSHPKILAEAVKEAETNRELRRALPGGIKGETQFGAPAVAITSDPR